jgi:hypothetical protein
MVHSSPGFLSGTGFSAEQIVPAWFWNSGEAPLRSTFLRRNIETAADHVVSLEKSRVKAQPDGCNFKKFYMQMIL